PSWLVKAPLLLLRLVALAALVAMLMQPMLRIRQSERIRSNVVLLVDNSLSMSFKDARLPQPLAARIAGAVGADPKSLTRSQILERIANSPSVNLLPGLSQSYNIKLYNFASDPSSQSLPTDKNEMKRARLKVAPDERGGGSTQIGTALKRALDDVA